MNKMQLHKLIGTLNVTAALTVEIFCHADNPMIHTKLTADPAPMVHGNTVYLHTGHDCLNPKTSGLVARQDSFQQHENKQAAIFFVENLASHPTLGGRER